MDLFTYYRSTSSYRVRLALALKGLDYRAVPVNLLAGEQHQPAYRALNAQGRLPSLRLDSGEVLSQSPAILEYLEERYPAVPLLPADPLLRARHRGVLALELQWTLDLKRIDGVTCRLPRNCFFAPPSRCRTPHTSSA